MIESSRRHGHFDPRRHSNGSRPSGALIPAEVDGDAPAGLEWYAFSSRYFAGHRRHDLEAIKAYEAYLSAAGQLAG
jgi:hypothetical protein